MEAVAGAVIVSLAVASAVGPGLIIWLMLRAQNKLAAQILGHLITEKATAVIGGEPRDMIHERLELEKRKLGMEEEKHRLIMKRAFEQQQQGQEPWSGRGD